MRDKRTPKDVCGEAISGWDGIVLNDCIVQSASGLKCIALPVLCHANVTLPFGGLQVFGTGWEDSMLLHIFDRL